MRGSNDRSARSLSWTLVVALVVVLAGVAAACSNDGEGATTTTSSTSPKTKLTFYEPSTVLSTGEPGDVIAKEEIELDSSMHGTGWKFLFVSTTPNGDRVPVTGILMKPNTPEPPGGYNVVVWAHGTVGVGDKCAPSKKDPFGIFAAAPLLDAGDVVVAPDYEGLGVDDEIHPYLVGEVVARNVLDAARAAQTIGGGKKVVAWGWSAGGHAALFARSLAASYAPDLTFLGAAAQAPVTDAGTFLFPGVTDLRVWPYTAQALLAWSEVYHETTLTDLVVVKDARVVVAARQACTGDIADNTNRPLNEIWRSDPQDLDVWQEALRINSVPVTKNTGPVFLTHGDADVDVPVQGTLELFDALCAKSVPTVLLHKPEWDHATAWDETIPDIATWVADRFAGQPPPTTCPAP